MTVNTKTKTEKSAAKEADVTDIEMPDLGAAMMATDWQQSYMTTAAALGSSWCDFVGERFHAYAHAIDDVSHCQDLGDAWRIQAEFGQKAVQAYSEQTAKLGNLMIKATNGQQGSEAH